MTRLVVLAHVLLGLCGWSAAAFDQPPIASPQDKACRVEAASTVFETLDPANLGAHVVGKQIYLACKRRAEAAATPSDATTKVARRGRSTG